MTTAKEYAEKLSLAFVTKERTSNGEEFISLKDGSPEWMRELCHTAHADSTQGGMLPDDWRHEFIKESADLLAEAEEYEWDDLQLESDVYTHDLLSWLSSRNDRVSYCDEASEEGFVNSENGTLGRISAGQWKEKDEVLSLVRTALRELAEEDEEEETSSCPLCDEEKYEDDAFCNGDHCSKQEHTHTKDEVCEACVILAKERNG